MCVGIQGLGFRLEMISQLLSELRTDKPEAADGKKDGKKKGKKEDLPPVPMTPEQQVHTICPWTAGAALVSQVLHTVEG